MIRLVAALFLFSSFISSYSQGFTGDTWAQAVKNKKANLVLTNVALTKFSESVNGKGFGICFDIMDDFAAYVQEQYGIEITYQYKPVANTLDFQLFLNAVKASKGGVFGLGAITITEERQQIFDFTPSYFDNIAILVTDKSVPELSSLDAISTTFRGMKAVAQRGSTHDKRLKELQKKHGFEIVYEENSTIKIAEALFSKQYFAYVDFPNYLSLFSSRVSVRRHSVGDREGESFGFIMPKGSDWTPIITAFFNAEEGYTKSDAYKKVLNDNLTPKVVRLINLLSH